MPRSISRSPPYRRRYSPSPVGRRHTRRSRRDRSSPYTRFNNDLQIVANKDVHEEVKGRITAITSKTVNIRTINLELCCPITNVSLHRRRSRSGTPRRHRSRTPTLRRGRSPSPTAKRHKRQRSRSSSLSPLPKSRSPSLTSTERKNALQKLRKEEEVKKRNQQEVEMKQLEEETARRMEEAIRIKVDEMLGSEEIKLETERRIQEGRKKLFDDVEAQLWKEKEAALIEARRKESWFDGASRYVMMGRGLYLEKSGGFVD
ncbi:hypothetical protein RJ640_023698, partial [Escallonia rubra]